MNILLLVSIILGVSIQDVLKKTYNRKSIFGNPYFFIMVSTFSAMVFFALVGKNMTFGVQYIPYSILFALFYGISAVGSVLAISTGPLALTALIVSFSLMIPSSYGLVFLGDPIDWKYILGFALLAASLVLINSSKEKISANGKWAFFVFLAFLGNGMCSTIQKMQQMAFDGNYKSEFMITALFVVSVAMVIMYIATEKKDNLKKPFSCWAIGALNGGTNGAVNLFVMILSGMMPVSVMFPLISAGGVVVSYIFSCTLYKEKLSTVQKIGYALGILSVVFLSI